MTLRPAPQFTANEVKGTKGRGGWFAKQCDERDGKYRSVEATSLKIHIGLGQLQMHVMGCEETKPRLFSCLCDQRKTKRVT